MKRSTQEMELKDWQGRFGIYFEYWGNSAKIDVKRKNHEVLIGVLFHLFMIPRRTTK